MGRRHATRIAVFGALLAVVVCVALLLYLGETGLFVGIGEVVEVLLELA